MLKRLTALALFLALLCSGAWADSSLRLGSTSLVLTLPEYEADPVSAVDLRFGLVGRYFLDDCTLAVYQLDANGQTAGEMMLEEAADFGSAVENTETDLEIDGIPVARMCYTSSDDSGELYAADYYIAVDGQMILLEFCLDSAEKLPAAEAIVSTLRGGSSERSGNE